MSTNAKNLATCRSTRIRRRAVEKEYLAGYTALEIHDRLSSRYNVKPQTIRKDVVEIRKAWAADIDETEKLEGRHRYLASLREVREKALTGWSESRKGDTVLKGVDLALAHNIDKEIARLSGVNLKVDDKILTINLKSAIAHMENIIGAVFSVVHDQGTQDLIVEAIDAIAEE